MSTVYITEQGAMLHQSSRHLVVTKGKEKLIHIPLLNVERLVLFGNVQITTQAINLLLNEGIDVAFMSTQGRLRGRLVATESKNVFIRLAQYERYLEDVFQVEMARAIVKGKITNARAVILLYQKNHPEVDLQLEIATLDETLFKIKNQNSHNSLLGSEGVGTASFFKAFSKMFSKRLRFETRSRRPPKDPVNALLSLGYTLLTNEVLSAVIAGGMDPYIGFLHGVVYGRPSLALDIVEEFRHPLIDRFTLNLFNNEIFVREDFQTVKHEGIYLKKDAFRKYLTLYEKRMLEPVAVGNKGEKMSYRDIIKNQVLIMNKSIKTRRIYQPYQMRW
ncbi:MAG: CRISPR-associated endonuclease Cas1 [bacterium]